MTTDQKNQRLAEWCGFCRHYWDKSSWVKIQEYSEHNQDEIHKCTHCRQETDEAWKCKIPSYFISLDAVHDLEEKALDVRGMQTIVQGAWINTLQSVCFKEELPCSQNHALELLIRATAAQRAEALGLTLGLWKEGG